MRVFACVVCALLAATPPTSAQGIDVTIFTGLAYPLYDQRLTLQPGDLSIPGVQVISASSPVLQGKDGAVFGAALGIEFGLLGVEGRLDTMDGTIEFSGARYDLLGTAFPFGGVTASITAPQGRFEVDRVSVLSLNARIRTPGTIGLVVSGGFSYLPDIRVSGSLPIGVGSPQLPLFGFDAGLTLRATPEDAEHRFGVNGGAGLRIGSRIAFVAEVRAFYFRDYELRVGTVDGPDLLDELLADVDPLRFEPVFVNAHVGLSFKF